MGRRWVLRSSRFPAHLSSLFGFSVVSTGLICFGRSTTRPASMTVFTSRRCAVSACGRLLPGRRALCPGPGRGSAGTLGARDQGAGRRAGCGGGRSRAFGRAWWADAGADRGGTPTGVLAARGTASGFGDELGGGFRGLERERRQHTDVGVGGQDDGGVAELVGDDLQVGAGFQGQAGAVCLRSCRRMGGGSAALVSFLKA